MSFTYTNFTTITTFSTFKKTFNLFIRNIIKNPTSRNCALLAIFLICIDIYVSSILLPSASKKVAEAFSISMPHLLGISIFLFGVLWTLEKTLSHLQDIIFFPAINQNIQNLSQKVVEKVHQLPLSIYQHLSIPETINAIRRISQSARTFIKIVLLLIIPVFIKMALCLHSILQFDFIGFILIPGFLLCLALLYFGTQYYVKTREAAWQYSDQVIMRLHDSILNTKIARFHFKAEMTHIAAILKKEARLWQKCNTRLHLLHGMIALLIGSLFTLILFRVFSGVIQHNLSVGDFLLLKTQLLAAFLPFKQLAVEFRQLAEASIDIKKIIRLLELPEENKNSNKASSSDIQSKTTNTSDFSLNLATRLKMPSNVSYMLNKPKIVLSCHKLSFAYTAEQFILQDCTLQITSGSKIAILGENGCGKSSLLKLLTGLEVPANGKVLLYDQNIQQFSYSELSKEIHYIPQDLRLFNLTLRENLSYGIKHCTDADMLTALEIVELLSLIKLLPNGLDSTVGELGSLLSGGEIQRIALARALMLQPQILLLDETLHSLNIESEKKMLTAIYQVIPTVILVSHRPSTLNFVDMAYKIEAGKIIELKIPAQEQHGLNNHSNHLETIT